MNTEPKKLYRSKTNRVIAGVCGGIGEYLAIDPTIVRVVFVALVFAGGSGLLLYLILMLVIPEDAQSTTSPKETFQKNAEEFSSQVKNAAEQVSKKFNEHHDESRLWWGVVMLVLGVYLLLANFGFGHFVSIGRLWPLLLVALGIMMLTRKR